MSGLIQQAALFLTAAGLICIGLATLLARSWRAGLRMGLDLWLAAGLLRLGPDTDGAHLAAAAAIIAIRQLVNVGLRASNEWQVPPRQLGLDRREPGR